MFIVIILHTPSQCRSHYPIESISHDSTQDIMEHIIQFAESSLQPKLQSFYGTRDDTSQESHPPPSVHPSESTSQETYRDKQNDIEEVLYYIHVITILDSLIAPEWHAVVLRFREGLPIYHSRAVNDKDAFNEQHPHHHSLDINSPFYDEQDSNNQAHCPKRKEKDIIRNTGIKERRVFFEYIYIQEQQDY